MTRSKAAAQPSMHEIAQAVGQFYGISIDDLRGPSRAYAAERQVAYRLAWECTAHPSTMIGRWFNRDHATILHGVAAVSNRPDDNADLTALRAILADVLWIEAVPFYSQRNMQEALPA